MSDRVKRGEDGSKFFLNISREKGAFSVKLKAFFVIFFEVLSFGEVCKNSEHKL